MVWPAYQQWSTETSPSRRFELFRRIKHLSSVARLGSFENLFLAYVHPARRCPTIAATSIQAKIRSVLCCRTPLQATTLGGNIIAIPSYGDVLLSDIALPTTAYYEPTNRDKISILTGTHQPVASLKRSRHRRRHWGRPPSMEERSKSTSKTSNPSSPSTFIPTDQHDTKTNDPFSPSPKCRRPRRRYRSRYRYAASSAFGI